MRERTEQRVLFKGKRSAADGTARGRELKWKHDKRLFKVPRHHGEDKADESGGSGVVPEAESCGFRLGEGREREGCHMVVDWIPVGDRLPEVKEYGCSDYILLSFENYSLPDIGRYEVDQDGNGAFYPGDDERSYVSYGLFVNAWMPMIPRFEE